jgi:hypothetical protein
MGPNRSDAQEEQKRFWEDMNRKIEEGLESLRAGCYVEATPELFEDIKRRGRERLNREPPSK